jgi:hypothetical protein
LSCSSCEGEVGGLAENGTGDFAIGEGRGEEGEAGEEAGGWHGRVAIAGAEGGCGERAMLSGENFPGASYFLLDWEGDL